MKHKLVQCFYFQRLELIWTHPRCTINILFIAEFKARCFWKKTLRKSLNGLKKVSVITNNKKHPLHCVFSFKPLVFIQILFPCTCQSAQRHLCSCFTTRWRHSYMFDFHLETILRKVDMISRQNRKLLLINSFKTIYQPIFKIIVHSFY